MEVTAADDFAADLALKEHGPTPGLVSFTINGKPATQGSKDQFGRESCRRLALWRAEARLAGQRALARSEAPSWATQGPFQVRAAFCFSRPKSHYRFLKSGTILRDDAPSFCLANYDIDKLLRALNDALTGVFFDNDSQVCDTTASKRWVGLNEQPFAHVTVCRLA